MCSKHPDLGGLRYRSNGKCVTCSLEQVQRWRQKNPGRKRAIDWKAQGIDHVQAAWALAGHEGRCDLCGTHSPGGRAWQIDHCHEKGEVRGVLCVACNRGIGMLGDTLEGVVKAVKYLERFRDRGSAPVAPAGGSEPAPSDSPSFSVVEA